MQRHEAPFRNARRSRGRSLFASLLPVIALTAAAPAHTILTSWPGMVNLNGLIPPDPHGAAGPNGIVQTVNTSIKYFDKSGRTIWGPLNLAAFWASVGNTGQGIGDPKVIYDPASERFFVIMQENGTQDSFLNLAVSRSSDPAGSGQDQWFFYRINITEVTPGNRLGGDYPGLGIDRQALYLTYNMFPLPITGSPLNTQIIAIKKADIIQGVLTLNRVFTAPASGFTLVPATVTGHSDPGNKAYFVQVGFPTALALWVLEDPLGSATLLPPLALPIPPNGDFPGPGAPQAGTATRLDTLGENLKAQGNACWMDGALWFCYTGGVLFDQRTRVYYYRIDTDGIPTVGVPNLSDPGYIDGGDGVWTFQPALGLNPCGDTCIVYCESSATEFPKIMCAVRPRGASAFDPPFSVKQSPAAYVGSGNNPGDAARWGDYASVSTDPTDGTLWITHEWAPSSSLNAWGTWWAQISVTPPPARDLYVNNSDYCLYHTGARVCSVIPGGGPFASVQEGINNAHCGDVLHLKAGAYSGPSAITKALRLEAYDGRVSLRR